MTEEEWRRFRQRVEQERYNEQASEEYFAAARRQNAERLRKEAEAEAIKQKEEEKYSSRREEINKMQSAGRREWQEKMNKKWGW